MSKILKLYKAYKDFLDTRFYIDINCKDYSGKNIRTRYYYMGWYLVYETFTFDVYYKNENKFYNFISVYKRHDRFIKNCKDICHYRKGMRDALNIIEKGWNHWQMESQVDQKL